MSYRSLAMIVNSHARGFQKDHNLIEKLRKSFCNYGPFFILSHPRELNPALKEILKSNSDILFIYGGDGTLRQTLTQLVFTYKRHPLPKIGILRGGTMNTVASDLEICRQPLKQIKKLLNQRNKNIHFNIAERNLLKVNQEYGFIFSIGGFARFVETYSKDPDPNPKTALFLLTKTFFSTVFGSAFSRSLFEPFSAEISKDQESFLYGQPIATVSASTIEHIGFGFRPFYGIRKKENCFSIVVLKGSPKVLVFQSLNMKLGRSMKSSSLVQEFAKELKIRTPHKMLFMLDGDIVGKAKEFILQVGPRLRFIIL